MQEAETSDPNATAAAGPVDGFPSPAAIPSPWQYIAVIGPLYFLAGSLVTAIQLPLGLLWNQAFLFAWPSLLWLRRAGFRPLAFARANRLPRGFERLAPAFPVRLLALALILGISITALVCASAMMGVFESLVPPEWVKLFDQTQVLSSVTGPWLGVLFAGVIVGAPVAEELVFRGCLLPMLAARMRLGWALVIQAGLFSLIHGDPIGFLPRFVLGLVFGMLWIYTGSLWAGVFAHLLNNGISSLILLYAGPDAKPDNELVIAAIAVTAAALLAFLLWVLRRFSRPGALPSEEPAAVAVSPAGTGSQFENVRLYASVGLLALGLVALAGRL